MSNSAQYVDPYTGAARYTPAARTTDSTATYSDPFTGILTSDFERAYCLAQYSSVLA